MGSFTFNLDRGLATHERVLGSVHSWVASILVRVTSVYVVLLEGNALVRAEPFDAIELPLGRLWER